MHIVCHTLRVFLAVYAVYLIRDTVHCMQEEGGFVPPVWTMCAESISSLLIIINFSGNFLIYCSVLKPFKAYLARCCSRWKRIPPVHQPVRTNEAEGLAADNGPQTDLKSATTSRPEASGDDLRVLNGNGSSAGALPKKTASMRSRIFLRKSLKSKKAREDLEVVRLQYFKGAEESKRRRFMNERDNSLLPFLDSRAKPELEDGSSETLAGTFTCKVAVELDHKQ